MTKRILMFVFAIELALTSAGLAVAQESANDREQVNDKNAISMQAITMLASQRCFSSGTGKTFLKICITDNGNISWFESPQGYVHLQQREGYTVCSGTNPSVVVHGFDANVASDGWDVSTVSQPNGAATFPLIITRKSLDGVIQLKQTFTRNNGERGIDVKMDVKNRSPTSLPYVWLNRYFDADVDSTSINNWDRTSDSVWGKDPADWTRGLMLTAEGSNSMSTWPSLSSYSSWDPNNVAGPQYARQCSSSGWGTMTGDMVGTMQALLTGLAVGQTKTVTLRYRRF